MNGIYFDVVLSTKRCCSSFSTCVRNMLHYIRDLFKPQMTLSLYILINPGWVHQSSGPKRQYDLIYLFIEDILPFIVVFTTTSKRLSEVRSLLEKRSETTFKLSGPLRGRLATFSDLQLLFFSISSQDLLAISRKCVILLFRYLKKTKFKKTLLKKKLLADMTALVFHNIWSSLTILLS